MDHVLSAAIMAHSVLDDLRQLRVKTCRSRVEATALGRCGHRACPSCMWQIPAAATVTCSFPTDLPTVCCPDSVRGTASRPLPRRLPACRFGEWRRVGSDDCSRAGPDNRVATQAASRPSGTADTPGGAGLRRLAGKAGRCRRRLPGAYRFNLGRGLGYSRFRKDFRSRKHSP